MRFFLAVLLLWSAGALATSRTVTRADFGDAWPLVPAVGSVACVAQGKAKLAAFVAPGGAWYALNGAARSRGHAAIDPIWRDDPAVPGAKVSLRPLLEAALALCPT